METVKKQTKQKLYRVHSIIPRFGYKGLVFKDVYMMWCIEHRKAPVMPYESCILDYDPEYINKAYSEEAIDELFTEAEVKVFEAYLLLAYGDSILTEEVKLPIEKDTAGRLCCTFGSFHDAIDIYKAPYYCLGFNVVGCFDIRNKEPMETQEQTQEKVRADGFVYRGGQWVSPETARKEDLEKPKVMPYRIISSTKNTEEVADMLTKEELMDSLMSNSNSVEQKLAAFAELVHRLLANEQGYLGNGQVFGRGYEDGFQTGLHQESAYLDGFTKGFEEGRRVTARKLAALEKRDDIPFD